MVTARSVPGSVSLEVIIAVPTERVWRAITTPEEQVHFVPGAQKVKFEARLGGSVEFSGHVDGGGDYTMTGRVIEIDPPLRLAFTWKWKAPGVPETVIRFTLEPVEGGTRVSFLQSGSGQFEQARAMNQFQFSIGLGALKAFLESRG